MKERLVGAAVLVALGVWLIPWVLSGPERSTRTDADALELPVPADSSVLRSQTITLDNDREPPTPAVGHAETQIEVADSAVVQETDSPPPAAPRVSATPNVSPPDSAGAADGAGWYVQIGSYADEENARRQADRVSTFGYEARVSSFISSGRSMRRVRVGPQASRERAEAVVSALSAHGFVAQVVVED